VRSVKRNLYQCAGAIVKGTTIHCKYGRTLSPTTEDGTISVLRLVRGMPLEITACQDCNYYEENGPPIPKEERGWLSKRGGKLTSKR